jgi:hypothetical protein
MLGERSPVEPRQTGGEHQREDASNLRANAPKVSASLPKCLIQVTQVTNPVGIDVGSTPRNRDSGSKRHFVRCPR